MNVTILVDDRAALPGLQPEHGLALWIEAEGRRLLFDTGQGGALEDNARQLGLPLESTGTVVLSHGHYDHAGGLAKVLRRAPGAHVYAHPALALPRYRGGAADSRPISVPAPALAALRRLPDPQLHWLQRPFAIAAGIGLSGPISRVTDFEDSGGSFSLDPAGQHPDPFADDLALWLRATGGLVVCVGCAHAGLVNTLEHIRRLHPGERLRAVIGGFHLGAASPQRLQRTVEALREMEVGQLVPCHCTGETATAALQEALGGRVTPGAAGRSFRFESRS